MSGDRRYEDEEDEDYEEEEEEEDQSDLNNSQLDEKLNEAEQYKSIGNKHMASMEYNKAYNAYSTALKLCPLGPYSHVYLSNRAAALLSLKRYSAAIIDSRRAIALAPTFGKGHARLGQSLYFLKDYAGAIEAYQNALHYEPDNQVTMIYLTKAKKKLERSEEKSKRRESVDTSDAVSVAESNIIFSPETEERDHSAAILTSKTDVHIEERLHSAIDSKYPTNEYSSLEYYRSDYVPSSKTSKVSKETMDDAPYDESYGLNINRGTIHWASSQGYNSDKASPLAYKGYDEEEEEEEDGQDPDFDEALKLLERASAKLSKKQYKTAVDLYSAALFLVPDDFNLTPHLFVGRANALNGLLRHEGAYNDCKMALSHNPELAEAHTTMARSLFYLKDYRAAIESFDKAISVLAYGEFLSSLDELYYEKAAEMSKDQPVPNNVDDDAASTVSTSYYSVRTMGSKPVPKLNPPRFVSRAEALNSSPVVPSLPKQWADKVPPSLSSISVGPEREVTFLSEGLGVKLNRGPDGIIRVLYVSKISNGDNGIVRKGDIIVGDVVREAVGIDLRRPVTNVMWADTVALIKMAERPVTFVVATELSQPPPTVVEEITRALKQEKRDKTTAISESGTPKITISSRAFFNGKNRNAANKYDPMSPSFANGSEPVKTISKKKKASQNDSEGSQSTTANGAFAVDHALAQATAVFADAFQSIDHFDLLDAQPRVRRNVDQKSYEETAADTDESNDPESMVIENGDVTLDPPETVSLIPVVPPQPEENVKSDKINKAVKRERKIPAIKMPKFNLAQATAVLNPITQATSVIVDVFQTNDKTAERAFSDFHADKEVLFPAGLMSQGWHNDGWNETKWSRKLIFSGTVRRWMKGNDLWSEDPTSVFTMALFSDPSVIVLMRIPKSVLEVRALLNLPPDGEPIGKTLDEFMVADTVIDLKTCKLKLSKMTTPTSFCEDNRRSQFFEIITPKETFSIIAKSSNMASNSDILILTSEWERNISMALFQIHEQDNPGQLIGWKHNLVIGSLHSYIAHEKNNVLQKAISSAADKSLVDGTDEDGLTPLLFACFRRNSDAVSVLLSAGADRLVKYMGKTPYHICAEQLDELTLSVLLSTGRSKPNILDDIGRTPMYVAVVEGKNSTGSCDTQLLKRCLSLLESSGGLLNVQSPESTLPHPVPYLASTWRGAALSVVLSHCSYRYSDKVTFDGSLSSFYQYPIHACLIFLRDKIAGLTRKGRKREKSPRSDDEDLVLTLQVLLDHGFEPNERVEYLNEASVYAEELKDIIGFAPIQVLAAASLEIKDLGRAGAVKASVQESVEDLIASAAEVLIRNGARVNLDLPPNARPQRSLSTNFSVLSLRTTENQLPKVDRSVLKLDKNKALLEAFGSADDIKDDVILWIEEKCVDGTNIPIPDKDVTNVLDSKGPGGSDSNSCAICWKQFKKGLIGSGSKKKTVCVLSNCYLCDECCSKTLERDGLSYKISDGQFNLARKDITRQADEEREAENERIRQQKLRVEMAKRASEREKQDDLFGGAFDTVKGFFSDNVKEIKDLTDNIKIRVEDGDVDVEEEYVGSGSTFSATREAFYERGERLNILRDKSEALKDAGNEYLRLATELRKQQESKGFFSR